MFLFLYHGTLGESLFYYYFIYLSYFGSAGSSLLRVSSLAVASRGSSLVTAHRPLIVVTSLDAERRLYACRLQWLQPVGSIVAAPRFESTGSIYGSRALLLHGVWDLPGPGIEPMSSALAGRFFTPEPQGKPCESLLNLTC